MGSSPSPAPAALPSVDRLCRKRELPLAVDLGEDEPGFLAQMRKL